ncbi:MAG: D-glycero-beta-D-manno-heptose 1-phosphate adenylyltransferase [Candidatus Cloacimonetes bacterium]|nr:D-glycero-beta-D-manno-heptose 1-phosphate adenylyltransferase [Candidatus Cloacimonadota bacterium]
MKRIISIEEFSELKKTLKKEKIVFTNGCFDIIHAGHIQYLKEARELGNILIIGMNSDKSVKRLKGSSRPINNQKDRAIVLSSIRYVDYVIFFDEDTPFELIKQVEPNILVKGGDWKIQEIVGSDIVQQSGGIVKSLSFKQGNSTTDVIGKIIEIHKKDN